MGAVAGLFYEANFKNNDVKGLILDSPYANIREVGNSFAKNNASLPNIVSDMLFNVVNSSIK